MDSYVTLRELVCGVLIGLALSIALMGVLSAIVLY
jgi:hypothetical protein